MNAVRKIFRYKASPLLDGHIYFRSQDDLNIESDVTVVSLKNLLKLSRRNVKEFRTAPFDSWPVSQQEEILSEVEQSSETPIPMPAMNLAVQDSFCFTGGFKVKTSNELRHPGPLDALWPNNKSVVAVIKNSARYLPLLEKLESRTIPVQVAKNQEELLQLLCTGHSFASELKQWPSANT